MSGACSFRISALLFPADSEVSEIGHGCKIIGRVCTLECDTSCMAYCSGTCPFICMKDSSGNWIHVRKEVGL